MVSGRLRPLRDKPWLTRRHLAGQLSIDTVHGHTEGSPVTRTANGFRRLLGRGADPMPTVPRALFAGLVLGDVREQPVETADDFRGSGLSHLLAVSGQNVAFVLAATAPLISRLGLRGRWVASLGVLGFFALVTRFEPSVLRATVMAVLATSATTLGRRPTSVRLLALAVTLLLLIDPFLVGSVAFGLSVSASGGIILLARPLQGRLPGPAALTAPLSVTVAAQVGVAPVLIPVFGGLPLASLPANLLVGPLAGFVMTWGLTGGLAAGLLGGVVAEVVHLPTRAALWWVATVARVGADLPLGELDAPLAALACGAGAGFVLARRRGRPVLSGISAVVTIALLATPAIRLAAHPGEREVLDGVGEIWRTGQGRTVLVLDAEVHHRRILEPVRRLGIARIDLAIAVQGSGRTGVALARLRKRVVVGEVWAPRDHRVAFARTPEPGAYRFDDLMIEVASSHDRLTAQVDRPP
jgi:competence protein ComEC